MAGRRTNLALLVALVVAMGTGIAAFAVGTDSGRPIIVAHGIAGLAVVLLTPWKQQIVRRGLRRRRSGRAGVVLGVLILLTLGTGVAHAAARTLPGPVTALQLHVGAAVMGLLPGIWHVATRPARPRLADVDRRAVVRTGALVLAGGAMWRAIDGLYRMGGIPPRRFTGSHARGSDDPDRMPVTQWLFDTVPHLDPAVWELTVADRLGTRRLQLADLRGLPQTDRRVVLDCTGGWYAAQTWSGVPLAVLLDHVGARRVVVTSHTGYARAFPIGVADDLLLALDVAGLPLSAGHGAPARLVAPGRRGFWWVKWVRHIAVDDVPAWIQPPFPVQ